MNITTSRIFEIANQISASGQNPTLASVRKTIGGGSYTTISEAMANWRAQKTARETPVREAPPQAISDLLQQLGIEIWAQALNAANSRLAAERDALEKARQEIEAQRKEAAELADQASIDLETTRQEVLSLRGQLETERNAALTIKNTLQERERDLAVQEARTQEINARAKQLHEQLVAANSQNAELLKVFAHKQP